MHILLRQYVCSVISIVKSCAGPWARCFIWIILSLFVTEETESQGW